MDVLWVILTILVLFVVPAVLVGVGVYMGFLLGDGVVSVFGFSCLSVVTLILAYAVLLLVVCVVIFFSSGSAHVS